MKRLLVFLFFFISVLTFFACEGLEDPEPEKFRVMVSTSEGASVVGEASVRVEKGKDVTFEIEIEEGYYFKSVSAGEYDVDTGLLTIENVTEKMNVEFFAEKSTIENAEKVPFIFKGESGDTNSVKGYEVALGARVTVKANNNDKIFVGWSFGKSFKQGGAIVSDEREFAFSVTPEILKDGVLYVYANYMDSSFRIMQYDVNGGVINKTSDNLSNNQYYTVEVTGNRVTVTLSESYYAYCPSHSSFWDDGSFTRDGYVLAEYNTKPDGSGEAYSLGSKFYAENEGEIDVLYCIWKKASSASDFTYANFSYPCPVRSDYAPDWQSEGVIITGYTGTDTELVIPETLGGKYVIAIAEGAVSNKNFKTLVLNKRIQKIEDGAFSGCSSLTTVYYPDGLYSISNDAFDAACYENLKHLYVNASIAPRFANGAEGAFSVKLSRLLETADEKRIIAVGGSSVFEGLGCEYMEALFDGEYRVINLGTTRTTHGLIYLEAMKHFAKADDLVIYSPENSIYMMGESELYYKTLRDLESMNNFYRYIDISNYTNVFSAFSDYNVNYRYKRAETRYEDIINKSTYVDKYGDQQDAKRQQMNYPYSQTAYTVTLNDRVNSKDYDPFNKQGYQYNPADWSDVDNPYWVNLSETRFKNLVNHAIGQAKASGAQVVFAYCPCDENDIISEAKNQDWLNRYEALIRELYDFDAVLGSVSTYIYNHMYIYDSAFHLNDYGRTYRTYQLYRDITSYLSLGTPKGIYDEGTSFSGCIFEKNSNGTPNYKVGFLN